MADGPEWFASKRYGYGAGLPISWQGWTVTGAYLSVVIGAVALLGESNPAAYAIMIISTAVFLLIAIRTTKGGWRWRWGKED